MNRFLVQKLFSSNNLFKQAQKSYSLKSIEHSFNCSCSICKPTQIIVVKTTSVISNNNNNNNDDKNKDNDITTTFSTTKTIDKVDNYKDFDFISDLKAAFDK